MNKATDIPATPLEISVHRIAPRQNRPMAVARPDMHSARTLVILRIVRRFIGMPISYG